MKNKKPVIVIIGGTSGIGKAVAERLNEGNAIVHTASRLTNLDIKEEASIKAYFDAIGPFDHLIVTAGSSAPAGTVVELDISDAKEAFDTKFWGTISVVKYAAQYISQQGSITITSGMLSRKVVANTYVKTSINAALESVTKLLAKELAPVRVNAVSPGLTMSTAYKFMQDEYREEMYAKAKVQLPVGKVGTTDDIAQAYLLLMNNTYMTGSIIDVDGGALLN